MFDVPYVSELDGFEPSEPQKKGINPKPASPNPKGKQKLGSGERRGEDSDSEDLVDSASKLDLSDPQSLDAVITDKITSLMDKDGRVSKSKLATFLKTSVVTEAMISQGLAAERRLRKSKEEELSRDADRQAKAARNAEKDSATIRTLGTQLESANSELNKSEFNAMPDDDGKNVSDKFFDMVSNMVVPELSIDEAANMTRYVLSSSFEDYATGKKGKLFIRSLKNAILAGIGNRMPETAVDALINASVYHAALLVGVTKMLTPTLTVFSGAVANGIVKPGMGQHGLPDVYKAAIYHGSTEKEQEDHDMSKQLMLRAGDVESNPGPRRIGFARMPSGPVAVQPAPMAAEPISARLSEAINDDHFHVGNGIRIHKYGRTQHPRLTDEVLRRSILARGEHPLDHVEFHPKSEDIHDRMTADRGHMLNQAVVEHGPLAAQAINDMYVDGKILQDPTKAGIWNDILNIGKGLAHRFGRVIKAVAPQVYQVGNSLLNGKLDMAAIPGAIKDVTGAIANPLGAVSNAASEMGNIVAEDGIRLGKMILDRIQPSAIDNSYSHTAQSELSKQGIHPHPGPVSVGIKYDEDLNMYTAASLISGVGITLPDGRVSGSESTLGWDVDGLRFDNLTGSASQDINAMMTIFGNTGVGQLAGSTFSEPPAEITNFPPSFINPATNALTNFVNNTPCVTGVSYFDAQLTKMNGVDLEPTQVGRRLIEAQSVYNLATQSQAGGTQVDGISQVDLVKIASKIFTTGVDLSTLMFKAFMHMANVRAGDGQITTNLFGWTNVYNTVNVGGGYGLTAYANATYPLPTVAANVDPYNQYINDTAANAGTTLAFYTSLDAIPITRQNLAVLVVPVRFVKYLPQILLMWAPFPLFASGDYITYGYGATTTNGCCVRVESKWRIGGITNFNILIAGDYARPALAAGQSPTPIPNAFSGPQAGNALAANVALQANTLSGAAQTIYSLRDYLFTWTGFGAPKPSTADWESFLTEFLIPRMSLGGDVEYAILRSQLCGVAYAVPDTTMNTSVYYYSNVNKGQPPAANVNGDVSRGIISPDGIFMTPTGYNKGGGCLKLPVPDWGAWNQIMAGTHAMPLRDPYYYNESRSVPYLKLINSRIVNASCNMLWYGLGLTIPQRNGDFSGQNNYGTFNKIMNWLRFNNRTDRFNFSYRLESIVKFFCGMSLPVNNSRRGVFDGLDWYNENYAAYMAAGYYNWIPQTQTIASICSVVNSIPAEYRLPGQREVTPYNANEVKLAGPGGARPRVVNSCGYGNLYTPPNEALWLDDASPSQKPRISRANWLVRLDYTQQSYSLQRQLCYADNWNGSYLSFPSTFFNNNTTSRADWLPTVGIPTPMNTFPVWLVAKQVSVIEAYAMNAIVSANAFSNGTPSNGLYWLTRNVSGFTIPAMIPQSGLMASYSIEDLDIEDMSKSNVNREIEVGSDLAATRQNAADFHLGAATGGATLQSSTV